MVQGSWVCPLNCRELCFDYDSLVALAVEVPEAGRPHIEKLPQSGLVDIVVETRDGQPPLLKSWKVKSGESTCLHFDGKVCK